MCATARRTPASYRLRRVLTRLLLYSRTCRRDLLLGLIFVIGADGLPGAQVEIGLFQILISRVQAGNLPV